MVKLLKQSVLFWALVLSVKTEDIRRNNSKNNNPGFFEAENVRKLETDENFDEQLKLGSRFSPENEENLQRKWGRKIGLDENLLSRDGLNKRDGENGGKNEERFDDRHIKMHRPKNANQERNTEDRRSKIEESDARHKFMNKQSEKLQRGTEERIDDRQPHRCGQKLHRPENVNRGKIDKENIRSRFLNEASRLEEHFRDNNPRSRRFGLNTELNKRFNEINSRRTGLNDRLARNDPHKFKFPTDQAEKLGRKNHNRIEKRQKGRMQRPEEANLERSTDDRRSKIEESDARHRFNPEFLNEQHEKLQRRTEERNDARQFHRFGQKLRRPENVNLGRQEKLEKSGFKTSVGCDKFQISDIKHRGGDDAPIMASFSWLCPLVALTLLTLTTAQFSDYSDLRGPYCQRRGCCPGRQDDCSEPILGTLCYCDDFCNRTRNEDCCPDFWTHCKGLPPPPEPPSPILGCTYEGRVYPLNKQIKKNCNVCKCEKMGQNQADMLCEQHQCLIEPSITEAINSNYANYGWSASNYSKFWGHKLEEGIKLRLGTLQPQRFVMHMNPVRRIYDPNSLPREFDSEFKWPGWMSEIQDQGWCGSSWAITTAAVASDRFAILSKGREKVTLSAQHLLSCDRRGQQSCNGGYLDRAWSYIRKIGLVDEQCFPYSATNEKCRIPRRGDLVTANCQLPTNVDRRSKYKVAPAYRVGNETDIMYEILHSGPVQATMKVYHDFFTYKRGIYRHSPISTNDRTGYHSVRIVGWGEEYSPEGLKKYWKVANSWGPEWGENGYFRILRGSNECEIESFVLGTWAEVENKLLLRNEI
ncbi:Tubulointerstitial nephritis antigen-like [Tribolium castaneum]|uniref:Tubulointerstitial nephritis antigen-like n=2 Tax=Tribolium castaneum TaxID=7070 RepID=A0A139WF59_TRICA|nr:Tubulointerstitial nephritis antigen-like [Tribolium castaneum]